MIGDLISRQAAIDALDDVLVEDESCKVWFKLALQQLPSAERRGRWDAVDRDCRGYATAYKCSSCGAVTTLPYLMKWMDYDYCPNCGAKMDGEEE